MTPGSRPGRPSDDTAGPEADPTRGAPRPAWAAVVGTVSSGDRSGLGSVEGVALTGSDPPPVGPSDARLVAAWTAVGTDPEAEVTSSPPPVSGVFAAARAPSPTSGVADCGRTDVRRREGTHRGRRWTSSVRRRSSHGRLPRPGGLRRHPDFNVVRRHLGAHAHESLTPTRSCAAAVVTSLVPTSSPCQPERHDECGGRGSARPPPHRAALMGCLPPRGPSSTGPLAPVCWRFSATDACLPPPSIRVSCPTSAPRTASPS